MVNDSAVQFSPKSIDETSLRRFIAITVHSVQELAILRCERCFSVKENLAADHMLSNRSFFLLLFNSEKLVVESS